MKQIYMKCLVLLVGMVMGVGNLWAETEVSWVAADQGYTNGTQYSSATVDDNISLAFGAGGNDGKYYTTGSGIRIYANGYMTVTASNGNTISKIVVTYSGTSYTGTISADAGTYSLSSSTGTWIGSATSVKLTNTASSGHARIQKVVVTYFSGESTYATTPSLTSSTGFLDSQDVTITNNEDGATVYYTTDGSDPTTSSSSFTGTSNTISVSETTTVKAMAVISGKENSSVASATYTKLTSYTSITEASAAATTTATQAAFTFNGQVVTAANTKYAYIQDADGNAAVIYNSTAHGLTQGQTLTGTVICSIQLYNNVLEFTNLTSSTTGITTGTGTPTATTKALADVSSSDYGKLVTIEGLTYDTSSSVMKNGDNTITPYGTFMTLPDFTNGSVYTITGIVLTYSSTLEIAPRDENDIVVTQAADKQTPTITATYSASLTAGGDADVFAVEYDGDGTLSVTSSKPEVATASVSDKNVTVTPLSAGTSTITISASETENYYAASLGYNVTVKASDEKNFTWDLSKVDYASASTTEVDWTNIAANMTLAKGESTTNANNYLGGGTTITKKDDGTTTETINDHTRLYKNQVLTITPASGATITSVVFTCASSYADELQGSTWTNAVATVSGNVVTVTPTDGTSAITCTISNATRVTGVVVYYSGTPSVTLNALSLSGTYPTSFNKGAEFSHEGMTVTATYTDGTTKDVTENATFSTCDMSTLGTQTVTVSYTENEKTVTATYDITVNNVLTPLDYETVDFTTVYSEVTDNQAVDTYYGTSFTMEFAKPTSSTTPTKYYASGTAVRAYTGNTITITGASEIKNVIVNYVSGYEDTAATTAIDGTTATITFSKTCRFTSIKVVYVAIQGDVDVDGDVDMDDLTLLSTYLIGTNTTTITEQGLKNAELSGDDTINIVDLAKLVELLNKNSK